MKEIDRLVHTSADDLRTQLKYFKMQGRYPATDILQAAHDRCIDLGYKTKANLLTRVLNKIHKEGGK